MEKMNFDNVDSNKLFESKETNKEVLLRKLRQLAIPATIVAMMMASCNSSKEKGMSKEEVGEIKTGMENVDKFVEEVKEIKDTASFVEEAENMKKEKEWAPLDVCLGDGLQKHVEFFQSDEFQKNLSENNYNSAQLLRFFSDYEYLINQEFAQIKNIPKEEQPNAYLDLFNKAPMRSTYCTGSARGTLEGILNRIINERSK